MSGIRHFLLRLVVATLLAVVTTATVPHRIASREAPAWYSGDRELEERLAQSVRSATQKTLVSHPFATGSAHFDSEWLFGTYMMAAMGFGQMALEHPELAPGAGEDMDRCIEGMLGERARSYDRSKWGEDPIASLGGGHGHVAYLGYMNLALGLRRLLDRDNRWSSLNDEITGALERRILATEGFLETFPGETYPVDNASAVGSLGLHGRATGASHRRAIDAWLLRMRVHALDREGLLVQATTPRGAPRDAGRGSGTFLASYFLSYADRGASAALYDAGRHSLYRTLLGFGAMREYGGEQGGGDPGKSSKGDIDSGPVVLGLGVSSSGFSLGPSRAHGDPETFRGVYALTHLFGVPVDTSGKRTFATGGPLGDSILLAMLTAPRTFPNDPLAREELP